MKGHGSGTIYQGSYALNGYFYSQPRYGATTNLFQNESDISYQTKTPVFADALWVDVWPSHSDQAATNLFEGNQPLGAGLQRIAIPRHACSLSAIPSTFDLKNTLPGAVNVSFADTHVETVGLERLWDLHWHKNWVHPIKRPGRP